MNESRYVVDRIEVDDIETYVLRDKATKAEARIATNLGNNCYSFGIPVNGEWIDLIDPPPDLETLKNEPTRYGNPILFPFPNRIRGGKFSFAGTEYTFDKAPETPNSIHGLLLNQPYQVVDSRNGVESINTAEGASIVCYLNSREFPEIMRQYPLPFEIRITHTLKATTLTLDIHIRNTGDNNMPMGFGIHPYFRVPLSSKSSVERCLITVPASKRWELEELLPTGEISNLEEDADFRSGKPLAGKQFDDVLTGVILSDDVSRCVIDDQDAAVRMTLESDAQFRELVVYTPPGRPSICFEPYTCPTDAINLEARGIDAGVIVLEPGAAFFGTIRIIAEFTELGVC
jgi:aldose 1-epimerase